MHGGRIRAGQDVEQVIAETRPVQVKRYGEFVKLSYGAENHAEINLTGVTIVANKGRPAYASAWSCTCSRVFFEELTERDMKAFDTAYSAQQSAEAKAGKGALDSGE